MSYTQLTREERYIISHLRKQGFTKAQIVVQPGRHQATIGREFARKENAAGCCRPSKAQEKTTGRRNGYFSATDYKLVAKYICKQWSPEQVAGRLAKEGTLSMSHETIYKYIWADKAEGGVLWKHLRGSPKKRRTRYGAHDWSRRLAGKRCISERPAEVEDRSRVGDGEIDTVMGSSDKHCILTLVERKTGYVEIGKQPNRTKQEIKVRAVKLIRKQPAQVKTITSDHGTEFHCWESVEKRTGALFYFARPYHA